MGYMFCLVVDHFPFLVVTKKNKKKQKNDLALEREIERVNE